MQATDTIARLDTLESRAAIDRLIAGYAQAFDTRDEALLRSIWHADARLDLGATFGSYTGIDAIVASAHQNWQAMPHMHHWMANPLVDIDGDMAHGSVAVDCVCTHVELGPVQISGRYVDRFERRDGRWAIADRAFDLHYLTPLKQWQPIAGSETVVMAGELAN